MAGDVAVAQREAPAGEVPAEREAPAGEARVNAASAERAGDEARAGAVRDARGACATEPHGCEARAADDERSSATARPKVSIRGLRKRFQTREGERVALAGVDLDIAENEFVCVVGPSGCGKSTLLNAIAGLELPDEGEVLVDGRPVTGPGPERGVVFQQYALFPWRTVRQNVEFALELRGVPASDRRSTSERFIEAVGLKDFADAYPKELSGGMRQRVAIARAYAANPEVLLMDEPFGALDAQTRVQLQQELLAMWQRERKTCFFITHDVEEAVALAQRVVVMSARPGRVREVVDVDIPYPRGPEVRTLPRFLELKTHIWNLVYREFLAEAT